MKTLYIVRHAKSSWDYPELTDFERPLNKRGRRDAPFMGALLADRGDAPELLVASPATRAAATARAFAEAFGRDFDEVVALPALYEADVDSYLEIVRGVDDSYGSAMFFGHNPETTELAELLTGETIDNVPTAGVVGVEANVETWKDVAPDNCRMKFFDYPKKYKSKKR
jgi:phosphohistidine phosphatase